ncbi:MAG TPA: hypothetical protein VGR01_15765 [Burkholderiales bacterium]|jgi:hypothetical protein|nr:hypothetical protein [Burkholderiales bacterium]
MMPTSKTRSLGLWLAVLALAGCATTSHVITGKPRAPIDASQVTLYSAAPPKYEEIAVIEASSRSSFSFGDQQKLDAVIERLKKEAASLGANGVLLQRTGSDGGGGGVGAGIGTGIGGGGISIGTSIFTTGASKTGRGLAIFVPPESR